MEKVNIKTLLSNLKVLFVEDEEFARNELSRFLKRRVGKLYSAKNGREGLELFEKNSPDLIITDLKMPEMNGLEMIRAVRKLGNDCPVIIISAISDSETILKAVDIGIVKYIVKPVNTSELVDTMEELAKDILKNKLKHTVVNNSLIDKENKIKLEQNIKSRIAYFIKTYTGKGPRNVQAFIQGNNIDVKAEDVLTLLEINMISNNKNNGLVDYNRKLFYMENKEYLEKLLNETINTKVSLISVEPNSKNNIDILKFSF